MSTTDDSPRGGRAGAHSSKAGDGAALSRRGPRGGGGGARARAASAGAGKDCTPSPTPRGTAGRRPGRGRGGRFRQGSRRVGGPPSGERRGGGGRARAKRQAPPRQQPTPPPPVPPPPALQEPTNEGAEGLLGFRFRRSADAAGAAGGAGDGRLRGGRSRRGRRRSNAAAGRAPHSFVAALFQLVLRWESRVYASGGASASSGELEVDWDDVVSVAWRDATDAHAEGDGCAGGALSSVEEQFYTCPVCLESPRAARITRCGHGAWRLPQPQQRSSATHATVCHRCRCDCHYWCNASPGHAVFCALCLLTHLRDVPSVAEHAAKRCPVCAAPVRVPDLRPFVRVPAADRIEQRSVLAQLGTAVDTDAAVSLPLASRDRDAASGWLAAADSGDAPERVCCLRPKAADVCASFVCLHRWRADLSSPLGVRHAVDGSVAAPPDALPVVGDANARFARLLFASDRFVADVLLDNRKQLLQHAQEWQVAEQEAAREMRALLADTGVGAAAKARRAEALAARAPVTTHVRAAFAAELARIDAQAASGPGSLGDCSTGFASAQGAAAGARSSAAPPAPPPSAETDRGVLRAELRVATEPVVDGSGVYVMYGCESGETVLLHPANVRVLVSAFGSYAAFPSRFTAPAVQLESYCMTQSLRRRYPHFAHIPLGASLHLLEVDLTRADFAAAACAEDAAGAVRAALDTPAADELRVRGRYRSRALGRHDRTVASDAAAAAAASRAADAAEATRRAARLSGAAVPMISSASPDVNSSAPIGSFPALSPVLRGQEVPGVGRGEAAADATAVTGAHRSDAPTSPLPEWSFRKILTAGHFPELGPAAVAEGTGSEARSLRRAAPRGAWKAPDDAELAQRAAAAVPMPAAWAPELASHAEASGGSGNGEGGSQRAAGSNTRKGKGRKGRAKGVLLFANGLGAPSR